LKDVYRRGRVSLATAVADPNAENFHQWRKEIGYLRNQVRTLRPIRPDMIDGLLNDLRELEDYLSENHDLDVLRQWVLAVMEKPRDQLNVEPLLMLISERQSELQSMSIPVGERIYFERSKTFVSRFETVGRNGGDEIACNVSGRFGKKFSIDTTGTLTTLLHRANGGSCEKPTYLLANYPMRFDDLSKYFERLEATSLRLKMYEVIGKLFSKADKTEIPQLANLCQAQLLPPFEGIEIGMGERLVTAAIAAATNKPLSAVSRLYKKSGDLGLVAESLLAEKKRDTLTVSKAYLSLLEISRTAGAGSIKKKVEMLATLISSASPRSVRYLVRFAVGRLRLGFRCAFPAWSALFVKTNRRKMRRPLRK
jgi:hypothetical protein